MLHDIALYKFTIDIDIDIVMEAISREFRVALPWELLYADDFL